MWGPRSRGKGAGGQVWEACIVLCKRGLFQSLLINLTRDFPARKRGALFRWCDFRLDQTGLKAVAGCAQR